MNRVRFIIVYFGTLPPWMPAFLVSCEHNPDFDWLILSDRPPPDEYPTNVAFDYMDENEICRRCLEVLGVRYPKGAHPLKLTDFHPAYGVLFSDFLRNYEFWGHCDLDVIWGNITGFVGNNVLDCHDILTSRKHKLTGHFTLFRNCASINHLYQKVPGFSSYCEEDHCTRMDETIISRFLNLKFNRRRHRVLRAATFGLIQYGPRFFWDAYLAPTGAEQINGALERGQSMTWTRGHTFDFEGRETMYLHFHKLKQGMRTFGIDYRDAPEEFLINRDGLVPVGTSG